MLWGNASFSASIVIMYLAQNFIHFPLQGLRMNRIIFVEEIKVNGFATFGNHVAAKANGIGKCSCLCVNIWLFEDHGFVNGLPDSLYRTGGDYDQQNEKVIFHVSGFVKVGEKINNQELGAATKS